MRYDKISINGLNVFYRECGSNNKPIMLFFHGFPSASHMYRNLMPMLEEKFHCIAMDYPGFGQTDSPSRKEFDYTFNHLSEVIEQFIDEMNIKKYYMYVFDYGAPIGFRIAMKYPEKILGIVSQNGNVYKEGLGKKWKARAEYWSNPTKEIREQYKTAFAKDTVYSQYIFGTEEGTVSPDGYSLDLFYAMTIDDYAEKQSDLIFDYQNNIKLYPAFQNYLREYQPKLLAVWGKDDPSFVWAGAMAFAKDVPNAKIIPVNNGHFALENCCQEIADSIKEFFG